MGGVRGRRADLTNETFYDALAFSLANNVLLCIQLPSFCISMYAVAMQLFCYRCITVMQK